MIYILAEGILHSSTAKKQKEVLEEARNAPPKSVLFLQKNISYDFLTPKKGTITNLATGRIIRLNNRSSEYVRALTSKNKTIYYTAPSTSKKSYFVNSYLNGYVPYVSASVWAPLNELRLKFKYSLDNNTYEGSPEIWQTSKESFIKLRGDCEDHAIALADWLIGLGHDARVVIGNVKFRGQPRGGHAWVILFKDSKEYLLEATRKHKWNQLPLASSLPYYFPKAMFNRNFLWSNTGSEYTVNYSDKKWIKTSKFSAFNSFYPDLQKKRLFINTMPSDTNIYFIDKEEKYFQGMELNVGRYILRVEKNNFLSKDILVNINSHDVNVEVRLMGKENP